MAEDVIRYADQNNLDKFTLLGHSMGGKTAMVLSAMHPKRIDGLIIVDAPPKTDKTNTGYSAKTVELVKYL